MALTPEGFNQVMEGIGQRMLLQDIVDDLMKNRRLPIAVDKQLLPTRVIPQQKLAASPYGMIELNKYNEGINYGTNV